MKIYLENHGENVGGMGKICYLCMLFPTSFIDVIDVVEVSKKRVFFRVNQPKFIKTKKQNGEFRDNPVSRGNSGASHQRGHDL